MANLIIQENGSARTRPAVNGEEITVKAPCNCSAVTGVQINGVTFPFYDAAGNSLSNMPDLFTKDSLIRVLIDTDNTRAYILNASDMKASVYDPQRKKQDVFKYVDDSLSQFNPNNLAEPVPVEKGGTGATTSKDALTNLGAASKTEAQGYANTAETNAKAASDPKGSASAVQGNLNNHTADTEVHITADERNTWNGKAEANHNHDGVYAPAYTYSTTDLTAGTSALETGKIYLVYE